MLSTASLKISFLVYLAVFLAFVYLVLFFADTHVSSEENMVNGTPAFYYIIVLISFFVPNIGIMVRRRFKKARSKYNYVVTAINLVVILALGFMMSQIEFRF
jgi:uncharacterized membrane protein YhaH (DUF805 family)